MSRTYRKDRKTGKQAKGKARCFSSWKCTCDRCSKGKQFTSLRGLSKIAYDLKHEIRAGGNDGAVTSDCKSDPTG